jgi:hypothetical protein
MHEKSERCTYTRKYPHSCIEFQGFRAALAAENTDISRGIRRDRQFRLARPLIRIDAKEGYARN